MSGGEFCPPMRTAPHCLYNICVFFNEIESSKNERMRGDTERETAEFEGGRRKKKEINRV